MVAYLPPADRPGIFLIKCSCGNWTYEGTAAACATAVQGHTLPNHVINVRGWRER